MDFEKIILSELNKKGLSWDQFTKAYYAYIKLCEYFSFDPEYLYNDDTCDLVVEKNKKLDLTKIDNNFIICYGFAKIYQDILTKLQIKSEIKKRSGHEYLHIYIDDYIIEVDPCHPYNQDFFRVKERLETMNFTSYQGLKNKEIKSKIELANKEINYHGKIETIEVLEMIKKELSKLPRNQNLIENQFEAIIKLVNRESLYKKEFFDIRNYIKYLVSFYLDPSSLVKIKEKLNVRLVDKKLILSDIYLVNTPSKKLVYKLIKNEDDKYTINKIKTKDEIFFPN